MLAPVKFVNTSLLQVHYHERGPSEGPVAMLMHGFPYDIHSYGEVADSLVKKGIRVVIPFLRGYGPTRYLSGSTMRFGQQAALGADLIALLDALEIPRAVFAGYDWGGRAACVGAALYPERCIGLVSVNGYNIQDIAVADEPAAPAREAGLWYQFYFNMERGRNGLTKDRREVCRLLWAQWSPTWAFDDETFNRSAAAFDNPDFVETVVHSYRHRYGRTAGDPQYAELEDMLAKQPSISVPTITLDGGADGVAAATDGRASARHFTGPRDHRIVPDAGHNLPQEAPEAFARAVAELAGL